MKQKVVNFHEVTITFLVEDALYDEKEVISNVEDMIAAVNDGGEQFTHDVVVKVNDTGCHYHPRTSSPCNKR